MTILICDLLSGFSCDTVTVHARKKTYQVPFSKFLNKFGLFVLSDFMSFYINFTLPNIVCSVNSVRVDFD